MGTAVRINGETQRVEELVLAPERYAPASPESPVGAFPMGVPGARNVNALTAQHLTDGGRGSTFYDQRVDVRPAAPAA